MRGEIIHPRELDSGLTETWRSLQSGNPAIQSPFFAPEFTRAIGRAREDARVAVFSRDGQVVGFLPHHLVQPSVAKPIGGQINDYHGVISAEDAMIDPEAMLRAARLSAYDFNHAPASMTVLAAGAYETSESPIMDLTGGFEGYVSRISKAGKHSMKETERRIRKMTREVGPVRFLRNDRSEAAWAGLLKMKGESFDRKGSKSVLDLPWVLAALDELREIDTPEFAGLLSTVYAGDRLVAAHLGMRSTGVWAWWFNTYDHELRNLAPGLITILEAAKVAEADDVTAIDFGKGEQYYKKAFATDAVPLCEGSIERKLRSPGLMRQAQKLAIRTCARLGDEKWRLLAKRATRKIVGGSVHLPPAPAG